ncbi:MAG: type II toxin-antitoxin system VapC family toxin [Chloroflexota bacterium]
MTAGIVVDASAAIALVRREPAVSAITVALKRVAPGERLLVPDGFWLEVANVLIRRHRHSPDEVVEALRELDELGLESVRTERALVLVALDLAARHVLSAYDASYLALAEVEDAWLLTLDRSLAAAAGPLAIQLSGDGPRHLADPPAPYIADPVDWARFGPYLAELRAAARTPAARAR